MIVNTFQISTDGVHPAVRAGRPRDSSVDERILTAALRLLAVNGYTGMSMDELARAAGVSKPSIYRRWKTKIDVVTAAIATLATNDPPADSADVWECLEHELTLIKSALFRPNGMSIIATLVAHEEQEPALMELFRDRVINVRRHRIRSALEKAANEGRLPRTTNFDLLLNMMIGYLYSCHISGQDVDDNWQRQCVDVVRATAGAR